MTRSSAPPSASRMPSRNLGKELGYNLGEEEDAMTILLSCFSAREHKDSRQQLSLPNYNEQ